MDNYQKMSGFNEKKLNPILPVLNLIVGVGSIVGVGITSIGAYKKYSKFREENPDATKEQLRKKWAECYAIPIVIGSFGAVACAGNTGIGVKAISAAGAGYTCYHAMRKGLARTEGSLFEVLNDVGCTENPYFDYAKKHKPEEEAPEGKKLYYDYVTDSFFYSTKEDIWRALYLLNQKFCEDGCASFADFYDFLGFQHKEELEVFGWDADYIYGNDGSSIAINEELLEDETEGFGKIVFFWAPIEEYNIE